LPNRLEWLYTYLGASMAGARVVAANTRFRADELSYLVRDRGATTVVLQPEVG
jgi:long-chain acyl-CoA synthetase